MTCSGGSTKNLRNLTQGQANLFRMYQQADMDDRHEGALAYQRYNQVMRWFAEHYSTPLDRVVSVFVALSPNNDYFGNLRSLASVLHYARQGLSPNEYTVSTYGHAKLRAHSYAIAETNFIETSKGPKIRSFYFNLVDPLDRHPVTIDGHMNATWLDQRLTMREAFVGSKRKYDLIADDCRLIAKRLGLIPNQLQAIIWFARKRTQGIVYTPQLNLFGERTDKWRTLITPDEALPYPNTKRSDIRFVNT